MKKKKRGRRIAASLKTKAVEELWKDFATRNNIPDVLPFDKIEVILFYSNKEYRKWEANILLREDNRLDEKRLKKEEYGKFESDMWQDRGFKIVEQYSVAGCDTILDDNENVVGYRIGVNRFLYDGTRRTHTEVINSILHELVHIVEHIRGLKSGELVNQFPALMLDNEVV